MNNSSRSIPTTATLEFALAKLYQASANFPEAKKYLAKLLASDPNYVAALLTSGQVDIMSGDSQTALDPLNKALSLAIQFDNQQQKGSILQALGVAYQRLTSPKTRCATSIRRWRSGGRSTTRPALPIVCYKWARFRRRWAIRRPRSQAIRESVEVGRKMETRTAWYKA